MEYKSHKGIIIVTIILLIAIGTVVYYFFFSDSYNKPTPASPISSSTTQFKPLPSGSISKTDPTKPAAQPSSTSTPAGEVQKLPALRKISNGPVAGAMATTTPNGLVVRYVDRGVGHIYEAFATSTRVNKISNITIPKVYEAYWTPRGDSVIVRYTKDDATPAVDTLVRIKMERKPVIPEITEEQLTGSATSTVAGRTALAKAVALAIKNASSSVIIYTPSTQAIGLSPLNTAISPSGRQFSVAQEGIKGIGYISTYDAMGVMKKTKILDTPITQWQVEWPTEDIISLTTKPLSYTTGYQYFLNTKTGSMVKTIGSIKGLTTLTNSSADRVLYAEYVTGTITTRLFNLTDQTATDVLFKTLPEKCVWSRSKKYAIYCAIPTQIPSASYPDAWYRGELSLNDQIWYINTQTGEVELLSNPLNDAGENVDAINLSIDSKEQVLTFINKKDLTLWMIDLTQ